MAYSMKFHGTLVPPNEISLSSMEFNGTLRLSFYSIPCYPGLAWNILWNSLELWSRQIRKSPSSQWCHGIRRAPFQMTQVFHGIPWNFMELWCRQIKYHSVPWNSISNGRHFKRAPFQMAQVFHGIQWNIPWNSMELWCRQMKYHLAPWNSMDLWDYQYHVTLDFHGIFHGNPWNSGVAK